MTSVFPVLVGILEGAAAVVYWVAGDRQAALVWACYAVSAITLGLMR